MRAHARLLRRPLASGCLLLAAGFGTTFALLPWSDTSINDLVVFRMDASAFLGGALPYSTVAFEYPPLAAPVIALPGLLGTGRSSYALPFALLMFGLAACALALTRRLALLSTGNVAVATLALALAPLLTGAMIRTHFDLAPVALLLAALVLIASNRLSAGFCVLGLAAMTKGFPLIVAPVALAWVASRMGGRQALRSLASLVVTLAVLVGAACALSPQGAWDSLRFQTDRPVELESSAASVALAVGELGGHAPTVVRSHRSAAVVHSAADTIALIFLVLGLMAVIAFAVCAARGADTRQLLLGSLGAVAAFVVCGKVLSPQYLIWTLPLLALALAWRYWWLAAALTTATLLTLIEFPAHYPGLLTRDGFSIWLVVARDAALLASVCLVLRAMRQAVARPALGPPVPDRRPALDSRRA